MTSSKFFKFLFRNTAPTVRDCLLASQVATPPTRGSRGAMGLLSNRGNKPKPIAKTEVPATVGEEGDPPGKQTRFALDPRQEAATKIQKIKRGKSARVQLDAGSAKPKPKPLQKAPSGRMLGRRVSFGSKQMFAVTSGAATNPVKQLQDAIERCTASMGIQTPCFPPSAAAPEPTVSTEDPADLDAAVDAEIVRNKLSEAAVEKVTSGNTDGKQLISEALLKKVRRVTSRA